MEKILLIFVCVFSGILLRVALFKDTRSTHALNKLIIYFFIPLIALYHVPKISFSLPLIWLTITPFLVFGLSMAFYEGVSRILGHDKNTKAALILTSGISSTSFVGFPIFEVLYGPEGLAYGVLMSLGGTILVFNTVGISTLLYYSSEKIDPKSMVVNVLTFLPFLAFLVAISMNLFSLRFPTIIDTVLHDLIAPFSVIALITIGMQIKFDLSRNALRDLLIGQFFKLAIAPLLIFIFTWYVLDMRDVVGKIIILGSAIGSMNAMAIMTADKGLNPKLSILMPAIGIPLSVPLLFLIDYLLK